ncbi:MAG TPA: carboxymuconolactone decarboxylase family protein [Niabella sp.]|nr:carboxymuconolactone decarboxylase family protein [Niabella sp.]
MKTKRYNIEKSDPEGFMALLQLESFMKSIQWMEPFALLIKIRASQLNQCTFCINLHTKEAVAAGETDKRIALLNTWKRAPAFNDKEKVVLALTEALTLTIPHVSDDLYQEAAAYFDDTKIAQLAMAIGMINLWNRVVIASGILETDS